MKLDSITTIDINPLYEGLEPKHIQHALLWESVGYSLKEAKLTPDQIIKLFQELETNAANAGDNRTLLGKGKDKASELNSAWKDLKGKIYNSGPMKGFADAYDNAANKLKDQNPKAMRYITKYRELAEKHPIMQKAVYATLIAATGLSGAGLVGAAGLGLFKLVDQMLQGKDIRDALYQAGKTGATAAAVGGLKSFLHHTPSDTMRGHSAAVIRGATTDPTQFSSGAHHVTNTPTGIHTASHDSMIDSESESLRAQATTMNNFADKMGLPAGNHRATFMAGLPVQIDGHPVPQDMYTPDQIKRIEGVKRMVAQMNQQRDTITSAPGYKTNEQVYDSSKTILETAQIAILFNNIQFLNEGLWDTVKKGASAVAKSRISQALSATAKDAADKAVDYAKVKGANLTNKITADKLTTAWKKAYEPTDSKEIERILLAQGIDPKIIKAAFKTMKIRPTKSLSTAKPTITPTVSDKIKTGAKTVAASKVGKAIAATAKDAMAAKTKASTTPLSTEPLKVDLGDKNANAVLNKANLAITPLLAAGDNAGAIAVLKKMMSQIPDASTAPAAPSTAPAAQVAKPKIRVPAGSSIRQASPVPPAPLRTGGKVAGQLSQTPDAIRKRNARAASKTQIKEDIENKLVLITEMLQIVRERKHSKDAVISKINALMEYASGGSTSAGSIASIPGAGGPLMPVIRRMPAGQSFFGPAGTLPPKSKTKKKRSKKT